MPTPELINAEASRWMKRGLALLTENTEQALRESLGCFDETVRLRQTLPLRENPWFRYVLAAGWMNRADALTRLGSLEDAVSSYNKALALLQTLAVEENPLFSKRLALAWMNRGVTLQQLPSPAAITSFESALAVAEEPAMRAVCLANYGNALLQFEPGDPAKARSAFEDARQLLAEKEGTEFGAAETGLQVRRGICRAIACQLADANAETRELISAATDAVEDALNLVRHWQERGEDRFQELALELVHFGARAYQLFQPQFLAEFLTEMLPAFRDRHSATGRAFQFGANMRDARAAR